MKPTLMLVDDESRVLEVLVKTFESQYQIFSFTGAHDALELLKRQPVQVIITDERMPKMNGMTFLKEAKVWAPNTVNIILTAYTDINVAIEAINSAVVYRYVVKPWDTDDLRTIVRQAFERYALVQENKKLTDELIAKNAALEQNLKQLKETQEKLLRQEKLAVVGQLTASIGHELRNPLSRIKASAALMRNEILPEEKEKKELLQIIDNEVMISTKIINDLLDYSRDRKTIFKSGNFNIIIDETLMRMRFPDEVEVVRELASDLPDNQVDEGQIQQILINLMLNAIQAMEYSGKIYVRTHHDGDAAIVEIKDTGCGISNENLERIFEPLFTTKPKGIGLGMCIVKMLIEKHGGTIGITSRENIGTTVKIRIPFHPNFMEN
ncbi:ATP-binding protein [bacterium]|nr:ATP-binding protein [bacterium]NUN46204.1 response regulator [bacterium]